MKVNSLFLVTEVKQENGFHTQVYVKPTNLGQCLNGKSECPQKYKDNVVSTFIRRALTHSSSWSGTHQELERVSQNLVNNGYSNCRINSIKNVLNKWYRRPTTTSPEEANITLYYWDFMSPKYKEEKIMKCIIYNNVTPVDNSRKISLITVLITKLRLKIFS